ncbi:MAG: hypothetical protein MUD14_17770 [Hydrococcus sp. Prado102]|jgi:hypothetical protein|nr:hypothetical protein [Hydrococcus sp. Prado102]
MNSNKNPLSAFRYFKAGLKPLTRVSVWGPPSVIALVALLYWQYRSNPAWQSTSFDQPAGVENAVGGDPNITQNTDIGLEMPLQSIARDAENQQQSTLLNPTNPNITPPPLLGTQGNVEGNGDPTLLGRSTKPKTESKDTSNSSEIFMPLLPGVKNPSLVIPGQTNSKRQNNLVDSSVQSPINGLVKPKPVTVVGNPLQDAMGQVFTNPNPASTQTTPNTSPTANSNSEFGNTTGTNQIEASNQSSQTNGGFSNPSSVAQPPVNPNQPFYNQPFNNPAPIGQVNRPQPTAPANPYTYINSPVVQPGAVTQPPLQPAQTPYLNAPVSANQAPTGYINAPVQQAPQISPNQLNQPVDPVTAPEVQRAIEDFGASP